MPATIYSQRDTGAAHLGAPGRGVERVDLLWLHQEDRSTLTETTVEALAGLGAGQVWVFNHLAGPAGQRRAVGAPTLLPCGGVYVWLVGQTELQVHNHRTE